MHTLRDSKSTLENAKSPIDLFSIRQTSGYGSGVTIYGYRTGGQLPPSAWGSCPRAQQARGRETASPKIFYDYRDHKSEFDIVI